MKNHFSAFEMVRPGKWRHPVYGVIWLDENYGKSFFAFAGVMGEIRPIVRTGTGRWRRWRSAEAAARYLVERAKGGAS